MSDPTPAPVRLEARLDSLERLTLAMHARISEQSLDIQASFRQVSDELLQAERKNETHFAELKSETAGIKQEMQASEQRILAAFEKLIEVVTTGKDS